jgi:hypothetical protein
VIGSTVAPILLVDVDGVILPFGRPLSDGVVFDHIVVDEHEHRVARDIRDLFARLEAVFECVWATAWEEEAPVAVAPIVGMGSSWPVITFPLVEGFRTWKLPGVQSWCERTPATDPSSGWTTNSTSTRSRGPSDAGTTRCCFRRIRPSVSPRSMSRPHCRGRPRPFRR